LEFLWIARAWASAAGAEHHAPSIHGIWFPLANFLIFAYIIKRFALPLVRDFLKSRRTEILAAIEEAAERKRRAEALVQEYKARLMRLDQEVQSIHESLRADGEREKSKLLKEAGAIAAKIKEDAHFLADQEVKIARQQVREEIASQAVTAAQALVQRHISAADQDRLAEEFVGHIGQVK
jgi:F-type H+-transporting ATPase subunit b